MKEFKVGSWDENTSVYKYLKKEFTECPLGLLEKTFRQKDVKVNGKRVNKDFLLHEGDIIQAYVADDLLSMKKPAKPKIMPDVIYEDKNILICNKTAGLLVHGDKFEKKMTLQNMVISYLIDKHEYNPKNPEAFVPAAAHRIDRNTSGLVIFGKNEEALKELEVLFTERDSIHKKYYALVMGRTPKEGEIDAPLYKDDEKSMVYVRSIAEGGKEAHTTYTSVEYFRKYTLVEASILTGRTHQIRVHFASIGHPLVGDKKYGNGNLNNDFKSRYGYDMQFLHSAGMKFDELEGVLSYLSGKEFKAPLPKEEKAVLEALRKENKGF